MFDKFRSRKGKLELGIEDELSLDEPSVENILKLVDNYEKDNLDTIEKLKRGKSLELKRINGALKQTIGWGRSPLAGAAVVTSGITTAAFRMVGPIYGNEVGLETHQLAWFLAAFVLGGAFAQLPTGWLADRYDRRWVLIWLSVAAIASCGITVFAAGYGIAGVFLAAGLFGLTTFPIFSVAAAHANDFASTEERVELSAALMFYYAVGAIASPLLASNLIESFGPPALFAMVAFGHLVLVVFSMARMRRRPTSDERTPYTYTPRTSFSMGRLFGKLRDKSGNNG